MRLFNSLFLLFIIVMLQACASVSSIGTDFTFDKKKNNGLVIGSFTQDPKTGFGQVNSHLYFSSVTDSSQKYHIQARQEHIPGLMKSSDFADAEGSLFVLELPAGEYQLNNWMISIGIAATITPKISPPPYKFKVNQHEITYIGNIHMHHILGKNVFGMTVTGGAIPGITNESHRDLSLFRQRYSKLHNLEISKESIKEGAWVKPK